MMQTRVRWMLWTSVVGAVALTALGICVGSVGFENLLQPLLNPALDPEHTAMATRQIQYLGNNRALHIFLNFAGHDGKRRAGSR